MKAQVDRAAKVYRESVYLLLWMKTDPRVIRFNREELVFGLTVPLKLLTDTWKVRSTFAF